MSSTTYTNAKPLRFTLAFWRKVEKLAKLYNMPKSVLVRMRIEEHLDQIFTEELVLQQKRKKRVAQVS